MTTRGSRAGRARRGVRAAIVVVVVSVLSAAVHVAAGAAPADPGLGKSSNPSWKRVVHAAVHHGTSRALRSFEPIALPVTRAHGIDAPSGGSGSASMPDPITSYEGLNSAAGGSRVPPDPNGDVGPAQYVQAVNSSTSGAVVGVYDKPSGRLLAGPYPLGFLWRGTNRECEISGRGDPIVQYDALAQRWVLTQFAFAGTTGPFFQCVAVSLTNDATGEYRIYQFLIHDTIFPDYPKFGVWPDGYYMSVNLFADASEGRPLGQGLIAFDRDSMLAGGTARSIQFFSHPDFFGMLPSDVQGTTPPPAGAPNYFVHAQENGLDDRLLLYEFHSDFDDPSRSDVTGPVVLPAGRVDMAVCGGAPDCVPQPDVTQRLDAVAGGILMYPMAYRNFGSHQSLVLNQTVATGSDGRAGVRWYEIRDPGADATVFQSGTQAPPDGIWRWMGSIAMDRSGNIALGYSVSAPAQVYPGIGYAGRLATDPLGSLAQGEQLLAGGGSQAGSHRWGDYTSMSVDPLDDCTFWYTNEYYESTSQAGWKTRILSFKFPSCGAPPPGPTPTPSPSAPPGADTTRPSITRVSDSPDPFDPTAPRRNKTRIRFTVDEQVTVEIAVYTRGGRLVKRLARGPLDAGSWFAVWNGRNRAGNPVRGGTYVYRISAVDPAGNTSTARGRVTVRR